MKKSNILKSGMALLVLGIAVANFSMGKMSSKTNNVKLNQLLTVSSANAEGGISCGRAGSGCKYTINGVPQTDDKYNEYGK